MKKPHNRLLLTKIKHFFKRILEAIKDGFTAFGNWYYHKISVPLRKKLSFLVHNKVINLAPAKIILFNKYSIKVKSEFRKAIYGYLFILIWLIGLAIFTLYPLFYSLYLSFTTSYYHLVNGLTSTWVGFENYINVIRDATFLPLITTYFGKMIVAIPLIIVFSIIIAILVNNPIKLKGVWRTIFFLPVVISTGPVLNALAAQKATSLPSLEDSFVFKYLVDNLSPLIADPLINVLNTMLLILWYAGIPILIFLAGLQKVDPALYEAASIDGANAWDRFWKITLPSIFPLISVNIVYIIVFMSAKETGIIELLRVHMIQGGPDSMWHGYGYAAAIAWVFFIVMIIIMLVYFLIFKTKKERRKR